MTSADRIAAFGTIDGELAVGGVPLRRLAARVGSTPFFAYDRRLLTERVDELRRALPDRLGLSYAMKANPNLAVLDLFARLGSGFDIVSGGELERVLAAGGDPARIVFSGVGKTESEMAAALAAGILCFNVESASELTRLDAVAGRAGGVEGNCVLRSPGSIWASTGSSSMWAK